MATMLTYQSALHDKTRAAAHALAQKSSGSGAVHLVDNRPESVVQKKQADALANKPIAGPVLQKKENRTGLPDQLKSGMESLSGYSLDDVKVHYHSGKPAQLNALAYAQGTDIHIGPGQEKHLPHEAWHVVQQKQGRVKPTMQLMGAVNINDDKGLEQDADVMGRRALFHSDTQPGTKVQGKLQGPAYHSLPAKDAVDVDVTASRMPAGHSTSVQRKEVVQCVLYHNNSSPFTAVEKEAWNALVKVAEENGFAGTTNFITQVEDDVYDNASGVTVAGSLAGLKALIRAGILARRMDPDDAENLSWGEFAPKLFEMATRYGAVTGPRTTGGHAAKTYSYTIVGRDSVSIAEETATHGKTQGNLKTRRQQMKAAIDLYNDAVNAHADEFL